jgi:uncharacterized membrane protein YiaA
MENPANWVYANPQIGAVSTVRRDQDKEEKRKSRKLIIAFHYIIRVVMMLSVTLLIVALYNHTPPFHKSTRYLFLS